MHVAFNPAWLAEGIAACKSNRVAIYLRGPRHAAVIVDAGDDWHRNAGVRILMPVHIEPPPDLAPAEAPTSTDPTDASP